VEQQRLLEARVKRAGELEKSHPEAARRIWSAIGKLYGDKPWAAPFVEEAKQALTRLTKKP
jgi:hypothetical protein